LDGTGTRCATIRGVYTADWSDIGTKLERKKEISGITGIQEKILDKSRNLKDSCAAEIVAWAAESERQLEKKTSPMR
jgi:hypothetical protein